MSLRITDEMGNTLVADNHTEATAMVKDPYAPTTDTVNPWNTAVVSSDTPVPPMWRLVADTPPPADIAAPMPATSAAPTVPPADALIEHLFTYVPPVSRIHSAMVDINAAAKALAYVINAHCPTGERRADAINMLRGVVRIATAIIE